MKNYAQYLNNLPVIPDVAQKVLNMAEGGKEFSFKDLEDAIMVDPGLSSKILRVANSALYARQKEITQLHTAITLLGFNTIRSLVILVTGSSLFYKYKKYPFYNFFWKHSIITAFLSRDLALRSGRKNITEQVFLAGLLHNIGQVALFSAAPDKYQALLNDAIRFDKRISALEEERFGTNHKEVGYEVLVQWNFPSIYTDTAKEHGNDNITSSHKQIIILVSVADFLTSNLDMYKNAPKPLELIKNYMPFLGLGPEELSSYQSGFIERLAQDKLFQECQNLFSIN